MACAVPTRDTAIDTQPLELCSLAAFSVYLSSKKFPLHRNAVGDEEISESGIFHMQFSRNIDPSHALGTQKHRLIDIYFSEGKSPLYMRNNNEGGLSFLKNFIFDIL